MTPTERCIGTRAAFLLPSLKLKNRNSSGSTLEQDIHNFLTANFGGYTAAAGNLFGFWKDREGNDSYGEHREFTVALIDNSKLPVLKTYLSGIARQMQEECIYLETGQSVSLIYGASEAG